MLDYNITDEEAITIQKIAKRFVRMFTLLNRTEPGEQMKIEMTLALCHSNSVKLKLSELLNASDYDFASDIIGIRINLDQFTGTLLNGYVPKHIK